MTLDEDDPETRERLPAPADWWARAVWAVKDLYRHAELFAFSREISVHLLRGLFFFGDLGTQRQPEQEPPFIPVSAKGFGTTADRRVRTTTVHVA